MEQVFAKYTQMSFLLLFIWKHPMSKLAMNKKKSYIKKNCWIKNTKNVFFRSETEAAYLKSCIICNSKVSCRLFQFAAYDLKGEFTWSLYTFAASELFWVDLKICHGEHFGPWMPNGQCLLYVQIQYARFSGSTAFCPTIIWERTKVNIWED